MSDQTTETKIFRPRYWQISATIFGLLFLGGITCICLSFLKAIGNHELFDGFLMVGSLIGAALGLVLFLQCIRSRIVVRSDGLDYYSLGFHVSARWNELQQIRKPWALHSMVPEQIELRSKPVNPKDWVEELIGPNPCIPIGSFDRYWRTTELGREIFSHAPQLRVRSPAR